MKIQLGDKFDIAMFRGGENERILQVEVVSFSPTHGVYGLKTQYGKVIYVPVHAISHMREYAKNMIGGMG